MKTVNCECAAIPVYDRIRCMSQEDFDNLEDRNNYEIFYKTPDNKLIVGHFASPQDKQK